MKKCCKKFFKDISVVLFGQTYCAYCGTELSIEDFEKLYNEQYKSEL